MLGNELTQVPRLQQADNVAAKHPSVRSWRGIVTLLAAEHLHGETMTLAAEHLHGETMTLAAEHLHGETMTLAAEHLHGETMTLAAEHLHGETMTLAAIGMKPTSVSDERAFSVPTFSRSARGPV
jgi:hypothetical protein